MSNWMLYGAYGYTGILLAEEAVRRGHKPVLSGRSAAKLAPLANRLGLDQVVVDLNDSSALTKAVAAVDLVLHAAGPFAFTAEPMIRACIAGKTHYLDITGEIPVLQNTFLYDAQARQQGIALIPGVGFDVVPTDCMAKYVADQLPGATSLELAIDAISTVSAGTTRSMLELRPIGGQVRRNGQLTPYPLGQGVKSVRFSHGERPIMPIPWGDLVTASHTTGIPNITTYLALSSPLFRLAGVLAPVGPILLSVPAIRKLLRKAVPILFRGPSESLRQKGRSYVWACASDANGKQAQAWLETREAYAFTAISGINAVERTLALQPQGALTPALAFGAAFVLEVEGTRRLD
ncbi:MAG: saccharopine dehydrogenase NADP-binding domain-containing protein [Anaerolineae bacterium]|nr:saccharopine dehydrogenase NADP-binding domain-containing protein [Anaerolineae bacterium]